MATTHELVEAVKRHARGNYERSYGWSEVVECYDDKDIESIIAGSQDDHEAVNKMAKIVALRDERFRDAVGPDVVCGSCGKKFPENTCCPCERG